MSDDLMQRVLAWRKKNDGGRLHAKYNPADDPLERGPQLCVVWDHGGYHEIAGWYGSRTGHTDIDLLVEVFNWALDELTPSSQGFYGDRSYDAEAGS